MLPASRKIVKALAVAAFKCFENYRPGGMRVHGGSLLLEPTLEPEDCGTAPEGSLACESGLWFGEHTFRLRAAGARAQQAGFIVNAHTRDASISLANSIHGEHLLAIRPDIAFHVNVGPIVMPEEDFERVVKESMMDFSTVQQFQ